jgi:hypothetical protein
MNDQARDIENELRTLFESNFERLRSEGGHSLAPDVRETAWNQVLLYWRRLSDIALKVTDTEVYLNLPGQKSPEGRTFAIEGIVDIVREHDQTIMYDIKTHDAESVRSGIDLYAEQLNVYAHIWQTLRGEPLDETAVIATRYPDAVQEALVQRDDTLLAEELSKWNPVVDIPFNTDSVESTVEKFGRTIDAIENGDFAPPPPEKLREVVPGTRVPFAVNVCRNCDARYSCEPYRGYARRSPGRRDRRLPAYLELDETDAEREERIGTALDGAAGVGELEANL